MSSFPRYPPCASGFCIDPVCCAQGHKFRWPELVGKSGAAAKATIERDNPLVTVVFLPPGRVGDADYCCNRVYVVLNGQGNVFAVPIVG